MAQRDDLETQATDEDTIEVDGEKFSKTDWEEFKNDRNWRATNTERARTLSQKEKDLEHQQALFRDEQRTLAAERARLAEERGTSKDEGEQLPEYPDSIIDEPEKLMVAMKAREVAQARELRELKEQVGKLQSSLTETTRSVDAKVNRTVEYERVVGENKRMFDRYMEENPDITPKERDAIRAELQHRSRNPDRHGRQVGDAWAYTEQAIRDSDRVVRFERHLAKAQEEAENRALKGRRTVGPNGGFRLGQGGVPTLDDPVEKQAEYYYNLGEYSPDATAFAEAMGSKRMMEIMRYAVDQAQEELGGVPASR